MSYNPHFRTGQRVRYQDPSALFWANAYRAAQEARCATGEHKPTEVPAGRVVYAGFGRRRATGDRYCAHCDIDLPAETPRTDGDVDG